MSIKTVNNIDELDKYLSKYLFKEYIYCSIGSKCNEDITSFRYPSSDLKLESNAQYQMIPTFIRKNRLDNLVIIIDQFTDKQLYEKNLTCLKNIVKYRGNIEILIINYRFQNTIQSIEKILLPILNYLSINNICREKFMLVNFICYRIANLMELTMENTFRESLLKILSIYYDGVYKNCYYQWYGYAYFTYNYIYNYNSYDIFIGLYLHQLIQNGYKITNNQLLNSKTIDKISKSYEFNIKFKKKWELFLTNSISIIES